MIKNIFVFKKLIFYFLLKNGTNVLDNLIEYKKIIDHEQSSSTGEDNINVITRFYTSYKQNIFGIDNFDHEAGTSFDFSSQLTELNDRIHEQELEGSGFFFNELSSIT